MATNSYTIADQRVVNDDLQHEIRLAQFWTAMTGMATKTNRTAGGQQAWKFSGSPINVINDFRTTGRTSMIIPVLGRLLGYGQQGKGQVAGNESTVNWFWQSVFVGLKRYGLLFPDIVDQEAVHWAATVDDYKEELVSWWADYLDHDCTRAFYEGFSKHITDAAADFGQAKTKRYNPNFWCYRGSSDGTKTERDLGNTPDFSYTSATYLTNITTALGTVDTASRSNEFDHYTLEAIASQLPYARIKGWEVDGEEIYPLIIHSLQARTLRQDASWLTAQGQGQVRGSANPIFKNQIGRWGKIVVIENDKVARLPYYSGSTLNFFDYDLGADDTANNRYSLAQKPPVTAGSVQNVACALLLGANAMNKGVFSDLKFKKKIPEDYDMVTGIAGQIFYGYSRNDAYNEDLGGSSPTAPTAKLPCQSAVIATRVTY